MNVDPNLKSTAPPEFLRAVVDAMEKDGIRGMTIDDAMRLKQRALAKAFSDERTKSHQVPL